MNRQLQDSVEIDSDYPEHCPSDCYEQTFSEDLEALYAQETEISIEKNNQGIVIQHRSWPLVDAFKAEEDRVFGIPSSQPMSKRPFESMPTGGKSVLEILPSSPPEVLESDRFDMTENPTTSLTHSSSKQQAVFPLRELARPANGVFMEDSEDEDDDAEEALREQIDLFKNVTAEDEERIDSAREDPLAISRERVSARNESAHLETPSTSQTPALGLSMFSQRLVVPKSAAPRPGPTNSTPISIRTNSGRSYSVTKRGTVKPLTYEQTIAARSEVVVGKAQRSYYGIDIHSLVNEAKAEVDIEAAQAESRPAPPALPSIEQPLPGQRQRRTLMWTEKYRARKFTELVGDDRTHRSVLHWLKRWDEIVFPGSAKPKSKKNKDQPTEERPHRKVLLLTGPPGLGKTTLAHVCARQAGYEVQEINASDERSSNVVKGRIRDMAGTENVKNGLDSKTATGKISKAARPVCVVVDEVDGVVGGSSGGGGEGGFIKALIDLVNLDQRNSNKVPSQPNNGKKKKGDNFRLLRPLILICNDVYHPALRPLRQSTIAEIIHVRKPGISNVITRMQSIFDKEHIPFDTDGVRRLCEAAWGITSKKEGGAGSSSTSEGDIRGILVVCEWIAGKLRATADPTSNSMQRLTRRWVEKTVLADLAHGGGSVRGLGRGGPKELVERVFQEGAGFAKAALTAAVPTETTSISGVKGVGEAQKRQTLARLAEMISTSDSSDRIMMDCFTAYPLQSYQDDTYLSKPDQAYEWLHFGDALSSQVFGSSEWELAPYLSSPILAFHNLFATPARSRFTVGGNYTKDGEEADDAEPIPFSGPQASYQAHEATKQTTALLESLRGSLTLPLTRMYSSTSELAVEFVPYLSRLVSPNISPVLVGGSGSSKSTASVRRASEKALVSRAVNAMLASGVRFERSRVEFDTSAGPVNGSGGFIYRMEPALDEASSFPTMGAEGGGNKTAAKETVRFAVRQVLEQEFARESKRQAEVQRNNRGRMPEGSSSSTTAKIAKTRASTDMDVDDEDDSGDAGDKGKKKKVKRDFFGRVIADEMESREVGPQTEKDDERRKRRKVKEEGDEGRIWVTFHEGFSNAVRKPISLGELMRGF